MVLYHIMLGRTCVDVIEATGAAPPNRQPDFPEFSIDPDPNKRARELVGAVLRWLKPGLQIQLTVEDDGTTRAWIEPLPKPKQP